MRKNTKGQSPPGATAATLIGIITILLIFYILFLPPEAREGLLEDEKTPGEPGEPGTGEILLQAAIGRLEMVPRPQEDHPVPNIYLSTYTQAKVLAEINPFTIKKTVTGSTTKNFTFGIADPANTENVMLSFTVPKHEGTLVIKLNGYDIYEGAITQTSPPPVQLRKSYLRTMNTLEFSVTGFSLPSKEYSFTDAKIIGDVIDASRLTSVNTIPIADYEYNNLERAWLDYYPTCDQYDVGTLEISLNEKILFLGVPSCDSPSRQDIFQEDIRPGKNTVKFTITKGNAGIEQIELTTSLRPTKGFSDFFTITPELYEDVRTGKKAIVLDIEFVDDGKIKRAQANVNGRLDVIDQRTPSFTRVISNVINKGNNYIELMPLIQEVNIVRLEVRAE